ncbi:hypothetical protein RYX36_024166, partial [Vicia faba]
SSPTPLCLEPTKFYDVSGSKSHRVSSESLCLELTKFYDVNGPEILLGFSDFSMFRTYQVLQHQQNLPSSAMSTRRDSAGALWFPMSRTYRVLQHQQVEIPLGLSNFSMSKTYPILRCQQKKCHSDVKIRAGPSTSIPTIDPAFTQYRDPSGGSSTSRSSPMHSPHEEQGDDDDHAEQVVQDEADEEHMNAHILRNVTHVIRKRNGQFFIQPEGSSFYPSYQAATCITEIINEKYNKFWPTYGVVDVNWTVDLEISCIGEKVNCGQWTVKPHDS